MTDRKGFSLSASPGLLSIVAMLVAATPAHAQEPPAGAAEGEQLAEEVVVTAGRLREESVEKAPIAVSVVSSEMMSDINAADVSDLSAVVPNMLVDIVGVSPGLAVLSIRGFVTRTTDIATEPGVAVYVDGVYQTILTGSLVDTYDVESVEVLRGPQGALLGKSAGAGAILINRTRPKHEFGGKAEIEYGSKNLIRATGLVHIPLVEDKLALKLFGTTRHRDARVKNLEIPGADLGTISMSTVRAAIDYRPTDDFDLYLTADYFRDDSDQAGGRNISPDGTLGCQFFGACAPHLGRRNVTNATLLNQPNQKQNNVTAKIDWTLGAVKLTSITGYRHYFVRNSEDLDHTAAPILAVLNSDTELDQYSEELRLSSVENGGWDLGGRLLWILGGYWGHSDSTFNQPLIAFGMDSSQNQQVVRKNAAAFAHADFTIIPAVTLNAGVRYSKDKVEHDYNFSSPGLDVKPTDHTQDTDFDNTSYEAGLQFQATDDVMLYYRYAEGYRSGGFVGFPGSPEAAAQPFQPETSSSHEVGLKSRWFDGAFTFNVILFDTEFQDMQRDVVSQGPSGGFVQVTANAASATTKGVEVELAIHPLEGLTFSANGGYLDAKYDEFISFDQVTGEPIDLSSNPVTYAPEWTAAASIDYEGDLGGELFDTFHVNTNIDYRSSFVFDPVTPELASPGYNTVNASLGFEGGADARYKVTFYVDNAFDTDYETILSNISNLLWFAHENIGLTYGVKVGVDF